jgi:hypothetical protein
MVRTEVSVLSGVSLAGAVRAPALVHTQLAVEIAQNQQRSGARECLPTHSGVCS